VPTDVRRAAVVGKPVAHSLSPVLHGAAYEALGLSWTYTRLEASESELPGLVGTLDESWVGLSVTMPGKRAALEGIRSAGKTGTTNAYKDAWYVGFTGNLVSGIWFGNDDYASTNEMTGGSLPAMTWREVMAFAHQNLEIKPIPGLQPEGAAVAKGAAQPPKSVLEAGGPNGSGALSRRSFEAIGGLGDLLRKVDRPAPTGAAYAEPSRGTESASARPVVGRVAMP